MSENEIIGKLYIENQKQATIIKSLKNSKVEGKLRMKICDAQKYMMNHKDMVPESFYNDIMRILERRTDV
jgi:hypothetical protein